MAGSSTDSDPVRRQSRADPDNLGPLVAAALEGRSPERVALRDAVRWLLTVLRERAPGRSVEVRVPPHGAVQCVPGPRHTRGTPPNVIETDPVTFLLLATGQLTFAEGVAEGRIAASGVRADLSPYLPLAQVGHEEPPTVADGREAPDSAKPEGSEGTAGAAGDRPGR